MRLIFVHGINQQGKSADEIRSEWLSALEDEFPTSGKFTTVSVVAPFYGDVLATLVDAPTAEQAVAQGIAEADDDERAFVAAGLEQIALDANLTRDQIAAVEQEQAVAQGLPHDRRFIAIIRLIERVSPFQGEVALRLLKQAYAYLKRQYVADAVDALVGPELTAGHGVVVAHSLGTVIAFKLLRQHAQQVPLFVTLGSPLAVVSVQSALKRPRLVPSGVRRWLNAFDVDDFVTLGRGLTTDTFASGIENRISVHKGDDAHAITEYLRDPMVRQAIAGAI